MTKYVSIGDERIELEKEEKKVIHGLEEHDGDEWEEWEREIPEELMDLLALIQVQAKEHDMQKFKDVKDVSSFSCSLETLVRSRTTKCYDMWLNRFEGRKEETRYWPWRNRKVGELILLMTVNKTRIDEVGRRNGEHDSGNEEDKVLVAEFISILNKSNIRLLGVFDDELWRRLARRIHVFCDWLTSVMESRANVHSVKSVAWYGHNDKW